MTHAPLHPDVASAMARAMWARHKLPVQDRFWSKVDKFGDNECWEWIGYRNKRGYGVFNLEHKTGQTGTRILAPRMSWQLTNGPVPEDRYILHSCDNPGCVNPKHLRVGTALENSLDMVARGRASKPGAKLTEEQVKEIRQLRDEGLSYKEISARFSISVSQISAIVNRLQWKQV